MNDDREHPSRPTGKDCEKLPAPESRGDGEGKIWLKLRIPMVQHDVIQSRDEQRRVCNNCNKEFDSGKALGGHMRIHVQEKLKTEHQHIAIKEKERPQELEGGDSPLNSLKCPQCGKRFPSMKSLCGHMRCHPEREWRGIQPPPGPKNCSPSPSRSTSSSLSDAINVGGSGLPSNPIPDLAKLLQGWSATARRGRKSITITGTAMTPPRAEKERLLDAVEQLLKLAQGDSIKSGSGLTNEQIFEATTRNPMTNKAEIEDKNGTFGSKKRAIEQSSIGNPKSLLLKKLKIDEEDDYKSLREGNSATSVKTKSFKKKTKTLKLKDLDVEFQIRRPINPIRKIFTCGICQRDFPTHQALGGHKSSHSKEEQSPDRIIISEAEEERENKEGSGSSTAHKCEICGKCFPTGQALGGHKRCHWVGLDQPGQSTPAANSPGEGIQPQPPRVQPLEFDLNKVPELADENGEGHAEGGGGGDHASSISHNSVA
ncbi:hypothetical protein NMG60_11002008 [Bertholletia excelsa]